MRYSILLRPFITILILFVSACGPVSGGVDSSKNTISSQKNKNNKVLTPNLKKVNTKYKTENTGVEYLFSQEIKDTTLRVQRLENVVLDIAKDLETLQPKISNLTSIENELQNLVEQLDVLLTSEVTPQPPVGITPPTQALQPQALQKKPTPPPAPQQQTITSTSGLQVKDIRFGQHQGKIRIVLDITGDAAYSFDLDNEENLLVLEMPNTKWTLTSQKSLSAIPLIKSYIVETTDNGVGSRLIFMLAKDTTIINHESLKPSSSNGFNRIFVDIKL